MQLEHLKNIERGMEWHGEKAKIFYSKTFDIVQHKDRTELMKYILLLACLQTKDLLTHS